MLFEAFIFLHSLKVVVSVDNRKDYRVAEVYTTITVQAHCLKRICLAWRVLSEESEWLRLSNRFSLYMWYDEPQARFLVLSKHSQALFSFQQKTTLHNVGSPLSDAEHVDTEPSNSQPQSTSFALFNSPSV